MPVRAYYSAAIAQFLLDDTHRVLGLLTQNHHHALEERQRGAWLQQITVLQKALSGSSAGQIFFEFYIPRMGKRADVLLALRNVIVVIEFKVGASEHTAAALVQVEDYALDLKNFHEGSHGVPVVPVLVSTNAPSKPTPCPAFADDLVAKPLVTNAADLRGLIEAIVGTCTFPEIDLHQWVAKGYKPTPTIVEAAQVLYRTHSVADIARKDAGAKNLERTGASVGRVIDHARQNGIKAICFVTGVPGSGKTLAGLNIATARSQTHEDEHAVFLSGNGPLVDVLREALVRDKASHDGMSRKLADREVRSFIQNIHHFRDYYAAHPEVPSERVAVFDEAQRAWTKEQAAKFMQRKHGLENFDMSEPEFLLSVMDRHTDWCTVVCLIGGGQEINTGEGGILEWVHALSTRFGSWEVHISPRMALPEYGSATEVGAFLESPRVHADEDLHLSVSCDPFALKRSPFSLDSSLMASPKLHVRFTRRSATDTRFT